RSRAARLRHRLPRLPLLAGVQPRRQLHRDRSRDPPRRARPLRARAAGVQELTRIAVPAEAAGERLDRYLGGLPEVGSRASAERLQRLVRRRGLTRDYLALVVGEPRSRRGTIDAPVGRDRHDRLRHSLDTDTPRAAVTHFELVELLPRHALLRVRLETGRTHQIRVHLAAIDLPVAGDPTYGIRGDLGLERQFLHAARLAFAHPVTAAPIDVES